MEEKTSVWKEIVYLYRYEIKKEDILMKKEYSSSHCRSKLLPVLSIPEI